MSGVRVVAVTGATGFLGRHLVVALARMGAQVRILARCDPTHALWQGFTLDVVPGDLDNADALERLVTGADTVVHGAGLIKARSRKRFFQVNRDGTSAIAAIARRCALRARFILISSLAARAPQLSGYAASKRAGEEAARAAYAEAPGHLLVVRPPALYGPWDRETLTVFKAASHAVIPVFGEGRIAIMHVGDAAGALAHLAMGQGAAGLYGLADPRPAGYAMQELLGEAARALGRHPHFVRIPGGVLLAAGWASAWWGAVRRTTPVFTFGKAREMLHNDWSVAPEELLPPAVFEPKIGVSEGFRDTVAWYKAAKWLA